jgi:hypothetical protein
LEKSLPCNSRQAFQLFRAGLSVAAPALCPRTTRSYTLQWIVLEKLLPCNSRQAFQRFRVGLSVAALYLAVRVIAAFTYFVGSYWKHRYCGNHAKFYKLSGQDYQWRLSRCLRTIPSYILQWIVFEKSLSRD